MGFSIKNNLLPYRHGKKLFVKNAGKKNCQMEPPPPPPPPPPDIK